MNKEQEEMWNVLSEPAPVIDEYGNMFWYKNGEQHRDNDLPAVIWADGTKIWYKDGKPFKDNVGFDGGDDFWYTSSNK